MRPRNCGSYESCTVTVMVSPFVISTVPQLMMALGLAHLLNYRLRGRTFFRVAVLAPYATSITLNLHQVRPLTESPGDLGYLARKCASIAGIQREYVSNAASRVFANVSRSGPVSSLGTWYFQRPFGRSVYGTYRVDCSR